MLRKLSEFNRNVLIVGFGTLLSQLIPFMILPILTRIYSKSDFGILTTYLTVIAFVTVIINAKYDAAILLPQNKLKASKVFDLTVFIALIIVTLTSIFVLIVWFINIFYDVVTEEYKFIFFLPFVSIALGLNTPATMICLRNKFFKQNSINKILRAIFISILSIILGFAGFTMFGLVIGDVVGQLVAMIYLILFLSKKELFNIRSYLNLNFLELKNVAKEYINFPKFSIPAALSENAAGIITMLFLTSGFSLSILGSYGFALRVVVGPSTIIAKSIGDVFRQSASEGYAQNGNCKIEYISTFKKLFLLASIPFPFFFFFAPFLFTKLFGGEWKQAGEFVQIMTPMFFFQFISNPLGCLFIIAQKQTLDFRLQIFLVVSLLLGLSLGVFYFKSIQTTLIILTIIYCLKYSMELYFSYQLAQNKQNLSDNLY